ncbi:hypothetical protein PMAYCL1PPCAC_14678, partial [Pristionchus mayeri]
QLLDCGPSSFFHFGSLKECREHWYGVMGGREIPVHSTWEYKVGNGSIVEYSNLPPNPFMVVGEGSIVSGCYIGRNEKSTVIPDDVVVYSAPVRRDDEQGWVTVVIGASDDFKRVYETGAVLWSGTTLRDCDGTSLWEAPLFDLAPGAEQSLLQSLHKYEHRETESEVLTSSGWSMADVVRYVDVDKLIEFRRQRKELWWRYGPESLGEPPASAE